MGFAYYYLIPSLPSLRLGERPPITSARLLGLCQEQLPAAEMALLEAATLAGAGSSGDRLPEILRRWEDWTVYHRNLIARSRAARREIDPAPWLRPEGEFFATERRGVEEAMMAADPAKCQEALAACSWRLLDSLGAGHQFDFTEVVVYRLKLLLAESLFPADPEAGGRNLARLAEQLTGTALNLRAEASALPEGSPS